MPWHASSAAKLVRRVDRKSTRLNSSHTVIYTLSLHDALPICMENAANELAWHARLESYLGNYALARKLCRQAGEASRSEEHTSELQSHSDLHSFPTRRSSDLHGKRCQRACLACPA